MGGAIFLALAQTVFSLGLESGLAKHAPGVSSITVVTAGASRFRQVVEEAAVKGVIRSYNDGLQHVFYLAVGASVGLFLFSWGMGFKKVEKKKTPEKKEDEKKTRGGCCCCAC